MTTTERNQKLKYLITCMKCEVSGKVCDEDCPTQYDAGNMGEIIENLEAISKVLEQEPKTGKWTPGESICPCCGEDKFKDLDADIWSDWLPKYCPNCGAKMAEETKIEKYLNFSDQDTMIPAT